MLQDPYERFVVYSAVLKPDFDADSSQLPDEVKSKYMVRTKIGRCPALNVLQRPSDGIQVPWHLILGHMRLQKELY